MDLGRKKNQDIIIYNPGDGRDVIKNSVRGVGGSISAMQVERRRIGYTFLLQWSLATAVGAVVGRILSFSLGMFGFLLGAAVGRMLSISLSTFGFLLGFPMAFAIAGFGVGAAVGMMQRIVLRQWVTHSQPWSAMSVLGGTLGGAIAGCIISFLPDNVSLYIGSPITGALVGTGLGTMQYLVLRKWVYDSQWWVLTNAIGWTISEVALWFMVMSSGGSRALFKGVFTGAADLKGLAIVLLSGAISGIGTGIYLLWLLRDRKKER
jgi:hypothetical protein